MAISPASNAARPWIAPDSQPSGELEGLVLVLNAGSSSLKACLIDALGQVLWRDQTAWAASGALTEPAAQGEALWCSTLDGWLAKRLESWSPQLAFVAHRVVHGGDRFRQPTRIGSQLIAALEELIPLAPLHNGPAVAVIRWLADRFGGLEQWACFDTAFHSTLPPVASTYALPRVWRELGLRRYGFHGLNHQHVAEVVEERMGGQRSLPIRLISCHLGAGCSLCAIRGGRSIDTTMGFTPLEGLVMATRSGSVDPGLLLHLLRLGVDGDELERQLQGASGLQGLSELSGSMEELRQAAARGHQGAELAIGVFRHRLLQGIGSMAASLAGVDVVVLTGGIGEHDLRLRQELEESLDWLRPLEILVVPADEEGLMARSCRQAATGNPPL
ncbi:acetate kinase [Synechococcus sp. CS-1328]|uniref:acetate/propionate family kinase n=1 Tax=Synechococcus sp. CS-1328 TaxID=2847976 RepID=UPI0028802E57|nr:acetate kinase [Synechococcus sp. CS-1328]MCT0226225.1 acetate kinase [Synechococcus sp. CS-1328]